MNGILGRVSFLSSDSKGKKEIVKNFVSIKCAVFLYENVAFDFCLLIGWIRLQYYFAVLFSVTKI